MPYKDPEVRKQRNRAYLSEHYSENKAEYIAKVKERRQVVGKWLEDYKRTLCCVHCGLSFKNNPEWCDFHHVDKDEKEYGVSQMRDFGMEKLLKEIKKCIALCALCHRTVHR